MTGAALTSEELLAEEEGRKKKVDHVNFYDPELWADLEVEREGGRAGGREGGREGGKAGGFWMPRRDGHHLSLIPVPFPSLLLNPGSMRVVGRRSARR